MPWYTQIRVGEEKVFYVKVHKKLALPVGTVVKPTLSKSAEGVLEVVGTVDLANDPVNDQVMRGAFKLKGLRESRRVQVGCVVDALEPLFAEVQVTPPGPVEIEIPGDFAFHRQAYSVRQGAQRSLILRARFTEPPKEIPTLKVHLSNPDVAISRGRSPLEIVAETTYYESKLRFEGRKLNATTKVVAGCNGRVTSCELKAVPKDEEGIELKFELVPYSLGQNYRAVWDRKEPNKLLITTQHESTSRYLGQPEDGYPGQHGPPFRVLLAELISDNVCRRIVEEHAKALPHEFDANAVYLLHNKLMKEFTPIAHKTQLADPDEGKLSDNGR